MNKQLVVDADRCTGCRVCELACSLAHHGENNPKKSNVQVLRNAEFDVNIPAVSMDCDACGTCVEWCLPGALSLVGYGEAAILRKGATLGRFPVPLVPGAHLRTGGEEH